VVDLTVAAQDQNINVDTTLLFMASDVAFQILRVLEYERDMIGVDFSPEQIRFFRRLNDFPKLVH
jgi:hypothetical protein